MRWSKSVSGGVTTAIMALTVLTVGPTATFASPIPFATTGVLNGSSAGSLVAVTTNAPCISFAGSAVCAAGATAYDVTGQDAIFQSGASQGTIKDIAVTFPITAFKTANITQAGGPAMFDLLAISSPSGFAACTFLTSSGACSTGTFLLTQLADNQVGITLTTTEIGYIGTNATNTPYKGIFTSQLSGNLLEFGCVVSGIQTCTTTIGNILIFEATAAQTSAAGIGAIGQSGTIRSTWSVTESPNPNFVPEPASFVLIGSGLLGLGVMARRRKTVA